MLVLFLFFQRNTRIILVKSWKSITFATNFNFIITAAAVLNIIVETTQMPGGMKVLTHKNFNLN